MKDKALSRASYDEFWHKICPSREYIDQHLGQGHQYMLLWIYLNHEKPPEIPFSGPSEHPNLIEAQPLCAEIHYQYYHYCDKSGIVTRKHTTCVGAIIETYANYTNIFFSRYLRSMDFSSSASTERPHKPIHRRILTIVYFAFCPRQRGG